MVDTQKQIDYWRETAIEDLQVACELVNGGRSRHGLFFAHLALEKLLKAHVCRTTQDLAPRLHNLLRLAERTDLILADEQREFLARFDRYQIEGRYPDSLPAPASLEVARVELSQAEEMFTWLTRRL
ncbi:MAG: HEPN domain-containing protein [Acidobacteriota bacterium]